MLEHCPEDYEDWRVNKKGDCNVYQCHKFAKSKEL